MMIRRLVVLLGALSAISVSAAGTASAAPVDDIPEDKEIAWLAGGGCWTEPGDDGRSVARIGGRVLMQEHGKKRVVGFRAHYKLYRENESPGLTLGPYLEKERASFKFTNDGNNYQWDAVNGAGAKGGSEHSFRKLQDGNYTLKVKMIWDRKHRFDWVRKAMLLTCTIASSIEYGQEAHPTGGQGGYHHAGTMKPSIYPQ